MLRCNYDVVMILWFTVSFCGCGKLWKAVVSGICTSPNSISSPFSPPQYSVYCCILSLIACGVFLRVSFELKVLFLTVASTAYYIIILSTKRELFVAYGYDLYAQNNNSLICEWVVLLHNLTESEQLRCIIINWCINNQNNMGAGGQGPSTSVRHYSH